MVIQYQCNRCDKDFSDNSHLICHIKTHTEEKTYQCSQCDKAFSKNSDLKCNIKTHWGEIISMQLM